MGDQRDPMLQDDGTKIREQLCSTQGRLRRGRVGEVDEDGQAKGSWTD